MTLINSNIYVFKQVAVKEQIQMSQVLNTSNEKQL